jgi:zinc transport system ATP-binding protein
MPPSTPLTGTPLIKAEGLSHTIKTRKILDNVSLTLNEQDFITIIGPNGAGKSTLLKILIGLIDPKDGHVVRKSRLRVGYIPQKMNIETSLPLSTRRFITLNKPDLSTFPDLVAELSIESLLDKPAHSLSGGEWQRALLARALIDQPHAIILDEPAQNLDLNGQINFYKRLNDIHKRRKIAILMVSHDLHMVMASTRQVVCLYHHICCSGAPQVVSKDPEFINLFGQDMAALMAIYQHHHDHQHEHDQGHHHA